MKQEKPFECAYCGNYFVSSHYFILTLKGGEQFGICEKCTFDINCDRCGDRLEPHETFLEECTMCDKIYISCINCKQSSESLSHKIKSFAKRFLYRLKIKGCTLRSQPIQCCIDPQEKPLRFSGVFYLRKGAQEGKDRES